MRRIALREVAPGAVLAMPVYNERGDVLLAAGVTLTPRYLALLEQRGIRYVLVNDEETADIVIPEYLSAAVRQWALQTLATLYDRVATVTLARLDRTPQPTRLLTDAGRRSALSAALQAARIADLVEIILDDALGADTLGAMVAIKGHDEYTFAHSVEMTALAVLLGRRVGLSMADLRVLARGCLLHDIGKIYIAPAILKKPGALTDEEWAQVRQHPTWGYELLRAAQPTEVVVNHVAWQHHERQDGTGYPRGLRGANRFERPEIGRIGYIHPFAEIAAVADVYDALAVDRPYRPAMAPEAVVATLRRLAGSHLNQELVEVFLTIVPEFPIGTPVRVVEGPLAGYSGVVARLAPTPPHQPVVRLLRNAQGRRIGPLEIDLAQETGVRIATAESRL